VQRGTTGNAVKPPARSRATGGKEVYTLDWTPAGDVLATGSSASITNTAATNAQRFYRIRQLP